MKLYNVLKMFYDLRETIKFKTYGVLDTSDNEFYMSYQSFENLFNTNLDDIDNVMNFELLSSEVVNVIPIIEQGKLLIHIKGYTFNV